MLKKNLALLCDYGLDDATATAYLLQHSDLFSKIDILPVAGNFPLEVSMANAKKLISFIENSIANVTLVDTSSISQNSECLWDIHGNDGMGDILPANGMCSTNIIEYNDWINTVDSSYTVLSLGPCTVTLDIMQRVNAPLHLVLMGGNINQKPNYKGYEFNHGMDIDAFSKCVMYPHVIATLDSCHHQMLDFYNIPIDKDDLLGRFIKKSVELSTERNEPGCYIYDLVAAYYLIYPQKFAVETAQDKDGNTLFVLKYVGDSSLLDGEI